MRLRLTRVTAASLIDLGLGKWGRCRGKSSGHWCDTNDGAGKGKSHLATYVQRELGNDAKNPLVLHFFCDNRSSRRSTAMSVLISLLFQLLEATESPELHDKVGIRIDHPQTDFSSKVPKQDFWRIFADGVRSQRERARRPVCIVLDGLDECDTTSAEFLLSALVDLCASGIKTVVFTRPLPSADHHNCQTIDLDAKTYRCKTLNDINRFVQDAVGKKRPGLDPGKVERVAQILSERANGTFLWVALAMEVLMEDNLAWEELMREKDLGFLDKMLPRGLHSIYNRMLSRAASESCDGGKGVVLVIRHVAVAFRSLTEKELCVSTGLTESTIKRHINALRYLVIRTEMASDRGAIQLVHLSLKEHLQSTAPFSISPAISRLARPMLAIAVDTVRVNTHRLRFLDFIILGAVCIHIRDFMVQHLAVFFFTAPASFYLLQNSQTRSPLLDCLAQLLGLLLDRSALTIFATREAEVHRHLFSRCLDTLEAENPNGIWKHKVSLACKRTDHLTDGAPQDHSTEEVSPDQAELALGPFVLYACQHWVGHLRDGQLENKDDAVQVLECHGRINRFLKKHLLHWIEAMAWNRNISEAIIAMSTLMSVVSGSECPVDIENSNLLNKIGLPAKLDDLAQDAKQLLLTNRPTIEQYPLQTYSGALLFNPSGGLVRQLFSSEISWVTLISGVDQDWGGGLQVLDDHSRPVTCISFSPDGRTLASGSEDAKVRIWDLEMGEIKHVFAVGDEHFPPTINSIAFSPDGAELALGLQDDTVQHWDISSTPKLIETYWSGDLGLGPDQFEIYAPYSKGVLSVVFSPLGRKLAGTTEFGIRIWALDERLVLKDLKGDSPGKICFSPCGERLAVSNNGIKVLNTKTWEIECAFAYNNEGPPFGLAFSPDGKELVSASERMQIWTVATQELRAEYDLDDSSYLRGLALSPKDNVAATCYHENSSVRVQSLRSGKVTQIVHLAGNPSSIAFSPDGSHMASGCADGMIRLLEVVADMIDDGKELTAVDYSPSIYRLLFTPDKTNPRVVSTARDAKVRLYDLDSGHPLGVLVNKARPESKKHGAQDMAISSNGRSLASAFDNMLCFWNMEDCRQLKMLQNGARHSIQYSPDDKLLAGIRNDKLVVSNIETGQVELEQKLSVFGHSHSRPVFSGNGSRLAVKSARFSCEIILFEKCGSEWNHMRKFGVEVESRLGLFLSPNNCELGIRQRNDGMLVWDIPAGRARNYFSKGKSTHPSTAPWLRSAAQAYSHSDDEKIIGFSQDETKLAMLEGGMINIRDVGAEPKRVRSVLGPFEFQPVSANFAPRGNLVAVSAPSISTIQVWSISTEIGELMYNLGSEAQGTGSHNKLCVMGFYSDKVLLSFHTSKARNQLEIWDTCQSPGKLKGTQHVNADARTPIVSHDGTMVAFEDGEIIKVLNIETLQCIFTIPQAQLTERRVAKLFSGDGAMLLVGTETSFELWSISENQLVTLSPFYSQPDEIVLSRDGKRLGTVHGDSLLVWDVDKGEIESVFEGPSWALEKLEASDLTDTEKPDPLGISQAYWVQHTGQWVARGQQRVLYLPPDHRPTNREAVALADNVVATGSGSGRVTIMKFL